MRKLATIIIGGILISGCATETIVREVPATPAETSSAPRPNPVPSSDEEFLDFVNKTASDARYWADSEIMEVGILVCEALDSGASMEEVADTMEASATTDGDIEIFSAIMFAAVTYLCPEYLDEMENWVGGI